MHISSKKSPDVLWIDLREKKGAQPHPNLKEYNAAQFDGSLEAELFAVLGRGFFKVLVFHYSSPTSSGLRLLEKTKRDFPSLPIIMVTEAHSEALAVWALRTRVWDFFVEPVGEAELLEAINKLLDIKSKNSPHRDSGRMPVTRLSMHTGHRPDREGKDLIARARTFIEQHFHREITQKDLADHLNVSHTHLSRVFKQRCGQSFSQFLWSTRIAAAKMLMMNPDVSVTTVCYEVGCSDPGYFATKFRAETNMSPTEYRETIRQSKFSGRCVGD
jgi:YesN/AraC family two-component response regulator